MNDDDKPRVTTTVLLFAGAAFLVLSFAIISVWVSEFRQASVMQFAALIGAWATWMKAGQ